MPSFHMGKALICNGWPWIWIVINERKQSPKMHKLWPFSWNVPHLSVLAYYQADMLYPCSSSGVCSFPSEDLPPGPWQNKKSKMSRQPPSRVGKTDPGLACHSLQDPCLHRALERVWTGSWITRRHKRARWLRALRWWGLYRESSCGESRLPAAGSDCCRWGQQDTEHLWRQVLFTDLV